jgi:ribosomal protein S18 acetylase RimI-like enzyme
MTISPSRNAMRVQEMLPDDLPSMARVHCAAFPSSALSMLGIEAVRRYYEWQLSGAHESIGLGAFIDGELAGFCVGGVFRRKMSGYLQRNRWFLVRRMACRPSLVFQRDFCNRVVVGLRVLKLLPAPQNKALLYQDSDPTSFGILALAVAPRYQRGGVGQALMDAAELVARQRGFRRMNLSVRVSNGAAIGFYERLNWQRRTAADGGWHGEMIKCLTT